MHIKNMRIKCSTRPQAISNFLKHDPEILEFHLFDTDIFMAKELVNSIRELKERGIKVYLHHPQRFKGEFLDIMSTAKDVKDFYTYSTNILGEICCRERVQCIQHAQYSSKTTYTLEDYKRETPKMHQEIKAIERQFPGVFLWEHVMSGLFTPLNPYLISDLVKPLNLSICLDISHIFIAHQGDNIKLQEEIIKYKQWIKYYHVVDSRGSTHDGLPLGKGLIDWYKIAHQIDTDFIFEIGLPDVLDPSPMVKSVEYFNNVLKKLDLKNEGDD